VPREDDDPMPVAGSTRACSSGVQAARRSPLAPVRVEQAADDVRPAYRQQDVLLSRNACMFMCVHAGGRADYRGHAAMCSCMFVCMLCMAAVTNHDTQSRRTGLPVPDTSRWRRGADGCSCGRDRDFHVQVLSRCRPLLTKMQVRLRGCPPCSHARACVLMRVSLCVCAHTCTEADQQLTSPALLWCSC
jgi:hypothetical protein